MIRRWWYRWTLRRARERDAITSAMFRHPAGKSRA